MRQLHTQEIQSVSGAGLLTGLVGALADTSVPVVGTVVSLGQGVVTTVTAVNQPLGATTAGVLQAVV